MSRFSRFELIEPSYPFHYHSHSHYPSFLINETSIFTPKSLRLPSFIQQVDDFTSSFDVFDSFADLVPINEPPSFSSITRIHRFQRSKDEFLLQKLTDRVNDLESRFDRLVNPRVFGSSGGGGDRKYTWTKEIKGLEKGGVDLKYQFETEIKEDNKKKKKKEKEKEKEGGRVRVNGGVLQNYKWTAEIKGKDEEVPVVRKYTVEVLSGTGNEKCELKKKKGKNEGNETRLVQIEDNENHGAVVLRQAFAKRAGVLENRKGKKKEISPQEAALVIQLRFRAYLIHRSQVLRALRDLTVAKAKLKEIRASFNNFAYNQRIARDAEERQRFTEKIIVLLLTVDAIEGADLMVRVAKRSIIDELEAILDVVDPQPAKKSLSFRRRTFDMPSASINKEIAAGVAQVVELIDQAERSTGTFEACV